MESSDQTGFAATRALWFGIAFSFAFTGLIWLTGELWMEIPQYAERQRGAIMPQMWYLWQSAEPAAWTRVSAWLSYALHQVCIWYLIYRAQHSDARYSANLHWFNVAALLTNATFITLHLVQTQIWYDGLALDAPEFTSQASVVLMLVGILIIENQRRGMFFGKPLPISQDVSRTVRKYHGYYFSWAILYTFWYHPMEFTGGHLLGFLYMFFLILQGSLFFTRVHVNPKWTIVSEVSVVAHGAYVAWQNSQHWPRFLAGFLGMFVITQMHGLGLSKKTRWMLAVGYLVLIGMVYAATTKLADSWNAMLIPIVEFLLVVIVSLLILGLTRIFGSPQRRGGV